MNLIDKKTIENLAELARLELSKKERDSLLKDLEKILSHFEELKEIDTEGVPPMSGGTLEKNVLREDGEGRVLPRERAISDFPEEEKGFLRVPPVFE
jgi:aspartyl-tRNA(Asn)/glutamyl-tRNA(Gln) amidotransferase subunit C